MDTKPPVIHINVRFPAELITALRRLAQEDARSVHGEILWILRRYVTQREQEREQAR